MVSESEEIVYDEDGPVIPFLWLTVGLIIDMCNNGKIYVLYSYMPTLFFTAMLKGLWQESCDRYFNGTVPRELCSLF